MGVPVVEQHPRKVRVEQVAADPTLAAESGWIDMAVQCIVTRETVGAERTVFGITTLPPGAAHDFHRHPNAEEVELKIYDDESNATTAQQLFQRLINDDKGRAACWPSPATRASRWSSTRSTTSRRPT